MENESTGIVELSDRIASLAKEGSSSLVANLNAIVATVEAAPGTAFRPGRDTVQDRCKLYQAAHGALKGAMAVVEKTEEITGSDLSESKEKIKVAQNDLNDRMDALGC